MWCGERGLDKQLAQPVPLGLTPSASPKVSNSVVSSRSSGLENKEGSLDPGCLSFCIDNEYLLGMKAFKNQIVPVLSSCVWEAEVLAVPASGVLIAFNGISFPFRFGVLYFETVVMDIPPQIYTSIFLFRHYLFFIIVSHKYQCYFSLNCVN